MPLIKLFSMFVMLLLVGCSDPEVVQQEQKAKPAKLYTISSTQSDEIHNFPAIVEASDNATLAFRVSGVLSELPVRAGQQVKKGDLLAKLDPTDFVIQVEQATANFELASSQFKRSEKLLKQNLISQSMYDEAQAQLQVAKSTLDTAKKNLQYTELKAPFDGEIARTYVENFENVVAKQTVLDLQTIEQIDVAIQVPENIMANVKKGTGYQPNIIFDSFPNKVFKGTLKEWDTKSDPVTNTFRVVFSLKRPQDLNILPGMTANLKANMSEVVTTEKRFVIVPSTAIFTDTENKKHYLWVVNEQSKAEKRQVEIGELHDAGVEILSGVVGGDIVVAAGVNNIEEGMELRAWVKERGL
ncbi:efflux RND transporter periplasmic adaptor subunit [Flocculibacter collagenilyticus]|uniref:efflux RND transporter periplasmic adaptor subunit n=1 Tax=Flocculibacter collagenilyticus TaxID=2744479 RepID=UPI0018F29319|nr:efflux RND transporter periplasmic adaptor subunit [Flocculibacter collagenilyticus]